MMLSIFSLPKPFSGHIDTIQRNAVTSWTLLRPEPEVILLGAEEGTAEACRDLGVRHLDGVACNEHGTPLVDSLFSIAEKHSESRLMCYVNADIMLLDDFASAIGTLLEHVPEFLAVAHRWDLEVGEALDFADGWSDPLRRQLPAQPHSHTGIDVFVYPKGLLSDMPAFALGRTMWDNWIIEAALRKGVPVVDITEMTKIVHQEHGYGHYPGGKEAMWRGQEARRNAELAGERVHPCSLRDATHRLTPGGLRSRMVAARSRSIVRKVANWRCLRPMVEAVRRLRAGAPPASSS